MRIENGVWIPVYDHLADPMPDVDGDVWVTRMGMGKVWVQKITHWTNSKYFEWDGIWAWMPIQDEKPKAYRIRVANPNSLIYED